MNRNMMYDYLITTGMKPLFVWLNKKQYYTKFVLDRDSQESCVIFTDWGYIRGCDTINLCSNEVVIESKCYQNGTAKINIKYNTMEKFEVKIEEIIE